ncbi:MAG: hypothetical protein ABI776_11215 [Nocardioidaceae bacterium]
MTELAMLVGSMLFPVLGLALILWLTHLEETLPVDIRAAERRPEPPPILAIRVQRRETARVVSIATESIPVQSIPVLRTPVEQPDGPAIAV